ncbi:MAG: hypothetical protein AAF602_02325 [Myxococcota bacterium]
MHGPTRAPDEGGCRYANVVIATSEPCRSTRTLHRLALALCAAGVIGHQVSRADWFIDDAAIGFAYARNLAAGHGLVPWPGGERIEAYSHPSWVALLALVHLLGLDGFTFAKPFGMACGVALVPLVYDLGRRARPGRSPVGALLAPALLAASGPFAIWAASGLENAWFALLLTASVHRGVTEATRGGRPWSAVGFLLVTWTRPEGLLYAGLAGAITTLEAMRAGRTSRAWGFWAILLGPSLILETLRLAYFAWPLPNSAYAKAVPPGAWLDPTARGWTQLEQYGSRSWLGFALPIFVLGVAGRRNRWAWSGLALVVVLYAWPGPLRLQRAAMWPNLPAIPYAFATIRMVVVVAGMALLPLCAMGRPGEAARLRVVMMLIAGLAFWLGAGGDWMGGFRFASFTAPLACVLLGVGVAEAADAVQERLGKGKGWGVEATWVAAGLVGLGAVPALNLTRDHRAGNFDVTTTMMEHRVAHFRDVGARLRWPGPPVVADMDVGGWLWFAPHVEVVDLVGLVDIPVARHASVEFLQDYVVDDRRPDAVHLHGPDWWWSRRSGLMEHPAWSERYVQLRSYPDVPGVPHDPHPGLWVRRDRLFGDDPDPAVRWPLGRGWTLEGVPRWQGPSRTAGDTVGLSLPLRRDSGAGALTLRVWLPGHDQSVATWSTASALLDPGRWPPDGVSRSHVWWPSDAAPSRASRVGLSTDDGPIQWFDTAWASEPAPTANRSSDGLDVAQALADARRAERTGDVARARRRYEEVLARDPWRAWVRRAIERLRFADAKSVTHFGRGSGGSSPRPR